MAKLRPLWTPGGRASSGLPVGFPTLSGSRLSSSVVWLEDYLTCTLGTSGVASNWILTQAGSGAGVSGLAANGNSGSSVTLGVLQAGTGSTISDVTVIDQAFRSSVVPTWLAIPTVAAGTGGFHLMVRAQFGATRTSCIHGFGFVSSALAVGSNWITDPDTTLGALATTGGLVVTRNVLAYGGAGVEEVWARWYDATAGDTAVKLIDGGGTLSASPYKFEFSRPSGGTTITCYVDGVAVGTLATSSDAANLRPSFGVQTTTTTVRLASVDTWYAEVQTASAR